MGAQQQHQMRYYGLYDTKCSTIFVTVLLLWSYHGNGAKCDTLACNWYLCKMYYHSARQQRTKCNTIVITVLFWIMVSNVVLCLSEYFIVALPLWLPHAFPGSLFINPLHAHIVFEISTERDSQNPSGTSHGRVGSLEQVSWVFATQR